VRDARDRLRQWLNVFTRLKLYSHVFAVGGRLHFKELPRVETKHSRDDVRGERLDAGIEVAHHGIVIAARVLDVVLNRVQRAL